MTRANLQLTDYDAEGRPCGADLELVSASLSTVLTKAAASANDTSVSWVKIILTRDTASP